MTGKPFVILDRDGTVIVKHTYLADPDLVQLIPGAGPALRRLRELGFGLVMLTNQSAISRNILSREKLDEIHHRMIAQLKEENVELDGIYVCPHLPEDNCECRKPRSGLLLNAMRDLDFDIKDCLIIGDNICDIELAQHIGVVSLLVRTGEGTGVEQSGLINPDEIVDDIGDAVKLIEAKYIRKTR